VNYTGNSELLALEQGAPNYNRMLIRRFAQALPRGKRKDTRVLDFGAGIGALAKLWVDEGMGTIDCYEPDEAQCNEIAARGLKAYSDLKRMDTKYDLVFSSNVLEHIEDDQKVLEEIRRELLSDSGVLVIYVPAFQILFSKMDEKLGHFRRYSRSNLISIARSANLQVIKCEYVDSLGFVAEIILKIFRSRERVSNSIKTIKLYDSFFLPLSLLLDRSGFRHVLGKNLILIAKKSKS
jgi:2-polyprenyl-3-methyl-5-hydroxy-6-metoxy-1,4-benzoquinol methylase